MTRVRSEHVLGFCCFGLDGTNTKHLCYMHFFTTMASTSNDDHRLAARAGQAAADGDGGSSTKPTKSDGAASKEEVAPRDGDGMWQKALPSPRRGNKKRSSSSGDVSDGQEEKKNPPPPSAVVATTAAAEDIASPRHVSSSQTMSGPASPTVTTMNNRAGAKVILTFSPTRSGET